MELLNKIRSLSYHHGCFSSVAYKHPGSFREMDAEINKIHNEMLDYIQQKDTTIKELVETLHHICAQNSWLVMDQEMADKTKGLLAKHKEKP